MAKQRGKGNQSGNPQISDVERERSHERFMVVWTTILTLGKYLMVCGCVVSTAYVIFYLPIASSAGKHTVVELTQKFVANVNAHVAVAWSVAGATGVAWWRERRERLRERKEKDERLRELEKTRDPKVTSSGLNLEGTATTTGKGDA